MFPFPSCTFHSRVGHVIRAITDAGPNATVLFVDGIGACDHVHRAAMMSNLLEVPRLRALLPFVRSSYLSPSSCSWRTHKDRGMNPATRRRRTRRFFHATVVHFNGSQRSCCFEGPLIGREFLFVYLDDVYVVAQSAKIPFPNFLGNQVARRDKYPVARRSKLERGIVDDCAQKGCKGLDPKFGVVRCQKFVILVERLAQERLDEEEKLRNAISWVPDLQCAQQILVKCAGPRCHHFLRKIRPSLSEAYARGPDDGMMSAVGRPQG